MYLRFAGYFICGLAALSPAAIGQTDAALWRFVQPKAKAVIGVDWKRIQQTHAGALLREKMGGSPLPPGVEFLNDVDRVLISSAGNSDPDDQTEPPVLVAVRGHFNLTDVRKALLEHGAKRQMYGAVQVYRPQGKSGKDLAFALVDPQTVLIGDADSIFACLEHGGFTATDPNPTVARAAVMDATYDFWAVMATPRALASQRLMGMFTGDEFGEDAEGFEAGISFRDGMAMNLAINARTEFAAKKLSSEISKILKLSAKDKPGNPALADLARKMKIGSENSTVTITLRLTKDELEKSAQQFEQSRKERNVLAAAQPVVVKPQAPQPPPEKMVIRIEGLDGGTREVPLKP